MQEARPAAPAVKSLPLRGFLVVLLVIILALYLAGTIRSSTAESPMQAALVPTRLPLEQADQPLMGTQVPQASPLPQHSPTIAATLPATLEATATATFKPSSTPTVFAATVSCSQSINATEIPWIQITALADPIPLQFPSPNTPQTDPIEGYQAFNPSEKVIYLTFDDGPDPQWTPQILNLLKKYQAEATFFVLGRNAVSFPDILVQAAAAGHSIANHSYNHFKLTQFGDSDFNLEVLDTDAAIRAALEGIPGADQQICRSLRPPYGEKGDLLRRRADSLGYQLAYWSLDTEDWTSPAPHMVLKTVLDNLQSQTVVLMHDGGGNRQASVQALELILRTLSEQGYVFNTLCDSSGQAVIWP